MALPFYKPKLPTSPLVSASGTYGLTAPSLQSGSMAQSRPSSVIPPPGSGLATPPTTQGPTPKVPVIKPPTPPPGGAGTGTQAPNGQQVTQQTGVGATPPGSNPDQELWNSLLANDPTLNIQRAMITPGMSANWTSTVQTPIQQALNVLGVPSVGSDAYSQLDTALQGITAPINPLTGQAVGGGFALDPNLAGNQLTKMAQIEQTQRRADIMARSLGASSGAAATGYTPGQLFSNTLDAQQSRADAINAFLSSVVNPALSSYMSGPFSSGISDYATAVGNAQARIADLIKNNYYASPPGNQASTTPAGAGGGMGGLGINPGYVGQAGASSSILAPGGAGEGVSTPATTAGPRPSLADRVRTRQFGSGQGTPATTAGPRPTLTDRARARRRAG